MYSEPKLEQRAAQPYAAVRTDVTIPFGEVLGPLWSEVWNWLGGQGITASGAPFIRYLFIDMPRLGIEVGVPVAQVIKSTERITTGELPTGTYAVMNYTGPYDGLVGATAHLLAWGAKNNIRWQMTPEAVGERWVSRLESYLTDPEKWVTELSMLIAD